MLMRTNSILIVISVVTFLMVTGLSDNQFARMKSPASKVLCGSRFIKAVALTFDDGPHLAYSPRILDILAKYNAKATFFVVGKMVELHPELVLAEYNAGHEIGNHTYSHTILTAIDSDQIVAELENTREAIRKITGKSVHLFRPPSGRIDSKVEKIAMKKGYIITMWSVFSRDFGSKSGEEVKHNVLDYAYNGDIILLHDGIEATITALPDILKTLKSQGYQFLTVSELLNKNIPEVTMQ